MSEYVPTTEQVNAFKAAWHDADDDGQAGKRVEIALSKVLGPALAAARREGQAEAWDKAVASAYLHEDKYRISIEHDPNPYRNGEDQ